MEFQSTSNQYFKNLLLSPVEIPALTSLNFWSSFPSLNAKTKFSSGQYAIGEPGILINLLLFE